MWIQIPLVMNFEIIMLNENKFYSLIKHQNSKRRTWKLKIPAVFSLLKFGNCDMTKCLCPDLESEFIRKLGSSYVACSLLTSIVRRLQLDIYQHYVFSGLSSKRPAFKLTKHFKAALLVDGPTKRPSESETWFDTRACINVDSCWNISTNCVLSKFKCTKNLNNKEDKTRFCTTKCTVWKAGKWTSCMRLLRLEKKNC